MTAPSSVSAPPAAPAVRAGANLARGGKNSGTGAKMPVNRGFEVAASAETYLAIGVVVIIGLLIVPLPPLALDLLLVMSIGLSVLVLLVAISSNDPLEFSAFPSLLLLITLMRLGLNVSSTRLILSQGQA